MICTNCNTETANPKYCSISCSASANNARRKSPAVPRKPRFCRCGNDITLLHQGIQAPRKACDNCVKEPWTPTKTIGEITGKAQYQVSAQLRNAARRTFARSGRPRVCQACGYTGAAIDICHVKGISEWPDTALVSAVNDPTNLIALCKTHHWEFDHGGVLFTPEP